MHAEYGIIAIGILLMCFAFWVSAANNFISKLVFNILPFFFGVYLCLIGATLFGWIVVGAR